MAKKDKPAAYRPGDNVVHDWRERIAHGTKDVVYRAGEGELARFAFGPGRVTLLGGAPGQGKTALVMQMAIDALRLQPELRACICNVEMSPEVLLDRQLARLSGVDLTVIQNREFDEEATERIDAGMSTIEALADRLTFLSAPFDLTNVAKTVDEVSSELLVLDYIQRIRPPEDTSDKRGSVDATMDHLRRFADEGIAVVVPAAVARTKDKKGRSCYDASGLGLASFRESSELEYGADDAYLLVPHKDDDDTVVLRHLKARHGQTGDIELAFDRPLQRFTAAGGDASSGQMELQNKLQAAWKKAPGSGGAR